MWGNATGTKDWRLIRPSIYLNRNGFEARVFEDVGITKEVCEWADILVLQSVVDKQGIALAYEYQQEHGKKIIADFDDFIHPNDDSPFKEEQKLYDWGEVAKVVAEIADLITVTQPDLAKKFEKYNKNIKVLPNLLDLEHWDIKPKYKNDSDTIRIGWAGSMTHMNDLKSVIPALKRICSEFPEVRLIFTGETRIGQHLEGLPYEIMLGQPVEVWPTRLHGLRYDIGIAPLVDTEFNRCKSNIKWQEYAINEIPGVFSNIVYPSAVKHGISGFIAKNEEDWYKYLKMLVENKELREKIGKNAYKDAIKNYSLEKHINLWINAYKSLLV